MTHKFVKVGDVVKIKQGDSEKSWSKLDPRKKYIVKETFPHTGYDDDTQFITQLEDSSSNIINLKINERYFDVVWQEKVQLKVPKFCRGDKVILTNPKADSGHGLEEGWIGYVLSPNDGSDDIPVQVATEESNLVYYYFDEDELEVLTAAKPDIKDIKVRHDSVGLSFDDPLMKSTPADFVGIKGSALDKQVSGDHYKDCKIQPIEYIHANGLSYLEGNVIKYTTRHSKKNGRKDIEKAIHYLELILEMEYKDKE